MSRRLCQSVSKAGSLRIRQVRARDVRSRRGVDCCPSCQNERISHTRKRDSRGKEQRVGGAMVTDNYGRPSGVDGSWSSARPRLWRGALLKYRKHQASVLLVHMEGVLPYACRKD